MKIILKVNRADLGDETRTVYELMEGWKEILSCP